MATKKTERPDKEQLMKDLAIGLYEKKMLFFLIGALSSETNLSDETAKLASINQLKDLRDAVNAVAEIPDEEKPKIVELINKSIEICESRTFAEENDDK